MKNNFNKIIIVLISSIFMLISCKKEKKEVAIVQNKTFEKAQKISGSIVLPEGSTIKTTSLLAVSPVDKFSISTTQYTLDVVSEFSTELVMNPEGEIILMGYNYPTKKDHTINIKTTALGMVMNLPIALSLTDTGKLKLISKVLASTKLESLEKEISKSLISGRPITDTTNSFLIQSLADLVIKDVKSNGFEAKKVLGPSYIRPVPVKINTAGNVISFENNRVASAFAVGIYKKGTLDKSFIIPGTKLFATSITELYSGLVGDGYTTPFQQLYTLESGNNYDVKIRSGKPGIYDTSQEFKDAILTNIKQIVETIISTYISTVINIDNSCLGRFKGKSLITVNENLKLLSGVNESNLAETTFQIAWNAIETTSEAFVDCKVESKFFTGLSKLFNVTSHVFKIANNVNTTIQIYDWFNSKPSTDKYFFKISLY